MDVSHFHVFGSKTWAHIPDEKMKALHPKSEKCIFAGYCEDVKGYQLLQLHSIKIIVRKYVKVDENISTCKPNLTFVPSSLPKFSVGDPMMFFSSDDDIEDENPPVPAHLPLVGSIEHELAPTPPLSRWFHTT
jgi:hypothetical protein